MKPTLCEHKTTCDTCFAKFSFVDFILIFIFYFSTSRGSGFLTAARKQTRFWFQVGLGGRYTPKVLLMLNCLYSKHAGKLKQVACAEWILAPHEYSPFTRNERGHHNSKKFSPWCTNLLFHGVIRSLPHGSQQTMPNPSPLPDDPNSHWKQVRFVSVKAPDIHHMIP